MKIQKEFLLSQMDLKKMNFKLRKTLKAQLKKFLQMELNNSTLARHQKKLSIFLGKKEDSYLKKISKITR